MSYVEVSYLKIEFDPYRHSARAGGSGVTRIELDDLPDWLAENPGSMVISMRKDLESSDRLPRVLRFDGAQASISIERALKCARNVICELHEDSECDESLENRVQVALDDLKLMIGALK